MYATKPVTLYIVCLFGCHMSKSKLILILCTHAHVCDVCVHILSTVNREILVVKKFSPGLYKDKK